MHLSPAQVAQFFANVAAQGERLSLSSALKLPPPKRINKALASSSEEWVRRLTLPDDAHASLSVVLGQLAGMWTDHDQLVVEAYNKIKHGFVVITGSGWLDPTSDEDEFPGEPPPLSIPSRLDLRADGGIRVGCFRIRRTQEALDVDLQNIREITRFGSELLATVLVLDSAGALYS